VLAEIYTLYELDKHKGMTNVFINLAEVFLCFFLSCKANARVKLAKMGHFPHSSTLVIICIVRSLFVLFYVLFVCKCVLPPGDNPIAVNKYIVYQIRTSINLKTVRLLQLFRTMEHFALPELYTCMWH
jgi:hypothetical protein